MTNTLLKTLVVAVILISSTDVYARKITSNIDCKMNTNVTMNVNFQGNIAKAADALDIVDSKADKIVNMAKDLGLKLIQITSKNFNINSNNNNYDSGYRYNGNMGFKLDSYDKALKLLDMIKAINLNASLSVNSYSQGNCR